MSDDPQVNVRVATPDDAPAVLTMVLEIAAHQDEAEHVTVGLTRWAELLARPDVTVLVAEQAGEPVGYVSAVRRLALWTGGDVLALDDLYVRPGSRDLGVGRILMHELARVAGPDRLSIIWGVQPDNTDAIRFYERLGATLRNKVVASWPPSAQPAR